MNRILFTADEVDKPLPVHDPRAIHLIRILGVTAGSTVAVGLIDGVIGAAKVSRITAAAIDLDFDFGTEPGEPLLPITVLLGHPRPLVLKRLIRDLCTIGVERLIVCNTELGEKSYFSSSLWSGPTVDTLLIDGASIAGSTRRSTVVRARSVASALDLVAEQRIAQQLFFDEHAAETAGLLLVPELPAATSVVAAIGSERGWTDRERSMFATAGWTRLGLGPRVLRTETAATAVAAMLAGRFHASASGVHSPTLRSAPRET